MSKEDRKLIEKAKRAIGLSSNDNQPSSRDPPRRNAAARVSAADYRSQDPVSSGGAQSQVNLKDKLLDTLSIISQSKSKKRVWVDPLTKDGNKQKPAVNPNALLSSSGAGSFNHEALLSAANGAGQQKQEIADLEEPQAVTASQIGNLLEGEEHKAREETSNEENKVDIQLI